MHWSFQSPQLLSHSCPLINWVWSRAAWFPPSSRCQRLLCSTYRVWDASFKKDSKRNLGQNVTFFRTICTTVFWFLRSEAISTCTYQGLPQWLNGEDPCAIRRWEFNPWVRKIPWRRVWQSTPIFLPGESHGQGSLVGYSPWGQKESDMTEHTPKLIKNLKCKLAQGSVDTAVDKDDPWPQGSCNPVRRQPLKQEQQGDHCLVGACALVQAECRRKVLLGGGGIQGGFTKLRRNADVLFVGLSPREDC